MTDNVDKTIDKERRAALAKLGLMAMVLYVAPVLVGVSQAEADSKESKKDDDNEKSEKDDDDDKSEKDDDDKKSKKRKK